MGYRVKSRIATRFRIWATQRLREYIVKGFVLDDRRLKNPDRPFDYFDELLRRIQHIRISLFALNTVTAANAVSRCTAACAISLLLANTLECTFVRLLVHESTRFRVAFGPAFILRVVNLRSLPHSANAMIVSRWGIFRHIRTFH